MKRTAITTLAVISLAQSALTWGEHCPENSWFDGEQCYCNDGLVMYNGYCAPKCGYNEEFNGKVCDCIKGYAKLDGVNCRKCPIHAHYNVDLNRCQCDYGYGVQGTVCALLDGYQAYEDGTAYQVQAQSYPATTYTAPKTTTSQYATQPTYTATKPAAKTVAYPANQPVYTETAKPAVKPAAKPAAKPAKTVAYPTNEYPPTQPTYDYYQEPQVYDQEPQQEEYQYQEEPEEPEEPQCGQNQEFDGSNCVCKKGFILFRQACVGCPEGSSYDCTDKVCKCDKYSYYDAENNECASCGKNEFFSTYRQACKCLKGYKRYDGVNCRVCPLNSKYDKTIKSCRCNAGRYWNKNKCSLTY